MSKILIAVVVLAVAGYFIFAGGSKKNENVNESDASLESASQEVSESERENNNEKNSASEESFEENTSLLALMKKGGNYRCDVNHNTEIGVSSGIVYIAGEKIRGDFNSKVDVPGVVSMDVESHMISDGESVYTWTSLSNEGYKSPIVVASRSNEDTQTISFDESLNYKCESWSVDVSKFLIPTNITFKNS